MSVKVLYIDIETSPSLAHVWGLWNQNVSLSQLVESTEMLCFAAKWRGVKSIPFYSQHHHGRQAMVEAAHSLLDEADVVCHFNGKRFDVPHLNREFLTADMTPPSPYKQVDLLQAVKRQFKFPSNKLQYVSQTLGLAGKVQHEGFGLWVKCMAGDEKAWSKMRRYNRQDVALLEDMHDRLLPWIPGHPTVALYDPEPDTHACPACKSAELESRGYAYTATSRFQRYRCKGCGKWSRSGKADARVDVREVANG